MLERDCDVVKESVTVLCYGLQWLPDHAEVVEVEDWDEHISHISRL